MNFIFICLTSLSDGVISDLNLVVIIFPDALLLYMLSLENIFQHSLPVLVALTHTAKNKIKYYNAHANP